MNKHAFTKPFFKVRQVKMEDIICTSLGVSSTSATSSDDTGNFMLGRGGDGWDDED